MYSFDWLNTFLTVWSYNDAKRNNNCGSCMSVYQEALEHWFRRWRPLDCCCIMAQYCEVISLNKGKRVIHLLCVLPQTMENCVSSECGEVLIWNANEAPESKLTGDCMPPQAATVMIIWLAHIICLPCLSGHLHFVFVPKTTTTVILN